MFYDITKAGVIITLNLYPKKSNQKRNKLYLLPKLPDDKEERVVSGRRPGRHRNF